MPWNERSARRLELIFKAIHLELTADETDDLLEETLRKELGPKSEQRAIDVISRFPFVESVSKASKRDDERKIDLWVSYTQDSGHANTSIQAKSSRAAARAYIRESRSKYGRGYLKDSRRIVLNLGPQVSDRSIKRSFLGQLRKMDDYI